MPKLLFATLLLPISTSLFAYTFNECNNLDISHVDNAALSECSITLKNGYAAQINTLIKNIENDPKKTSLLKKNLVSSQKLFNSYRDEQCSYFFASAQDAPDKKGLTSQAFCEAGMNRQRLDFLKSTFN